MIKGLLFDKDGTLFDFNISWGRWARDFIDGFTPVPEKRQALASAFKLHYDEARFDPTSPIVAGTSQEIFRAIESVFPDEPASVIADKVRLSAQNAVMHPVCSLAPFLGELKSAGYRLGIATNDSEQGAKRQLEKENAAQYFDYVAGANSGFGAKPDKGMCVGFLKATGLNAREAAMIGDSQFDIWSGRAAGMHTIAVLTGTASAEELAEADVILRDITEIPNWLAENTGI